MLPRGKRNLGCFCVAASYLDQLCSAQQKFCCEVKGLFEWKTHLNKIHEEIIFSVSNVGLHRS